MTPRTGRPSLDFEHAHAPFAGSERLRLGVSVEFLSLEAGEQMRLALSDLVPVAWRWLAPDTHGCFSGEAEAYLPAGHEREVERVLEALMNPFEPGFSIAWVHLVA
jgi:hypothetical protein